MLNRGTDKRVIVADDRDRVRFLHDMFVFNDKNHALHPKQPERRDGECTREPLVLIHAFCLMNNHYHLLLSEVIENGISLFMQKLNMGYTKYFNERHGRNGTLWQGKYKKIQIERDSHFMYIPYYIHLNPLDYSTPEWRQGKVKDVRKALRKLREYRWSSHLDYLGVKNFPSLIYQKEIIGLTPARYEREIEHIVTNCDLARASGDLE